jgi:hypothetical protein
VALVPADAGTRPFYEVLLCPEPVRWVVDHVLPVLQRAAISRDEMIQHLAAYLRNDPEPVVIASWPEDIANLALLMVIGPGRRTPSPRLIFELLYLPLFDSESLSNLPHNARSDAIALRDYVTAQGLHAEGPTIGGA